MKPVSSDASPRGDYDIARRTLRLLAERRVVPTPEAYAEAWREIAGAPGGDTPLAVLRLVLRELVRSHRLTREAAQLALETAQSQDWGAVADLMERSLKWSEASSNWPQLVVALLKACDQIHPGWTRARKLDAVTRVAESGADAPELALERLTRLMDSWSLAPAPEPVAPSAAAELPRLPPVPPVPGDNCEREVAQWKSIAQRSLSLLESALSEGSVARSRAIDVRQGLRAAGALPPEGMGPRLIDLGRVVERETEEQERVRLGLARLLALLCDNMKTLAPDEAWLAGQLEPIRALLAGPIGSDALASAEQTLAQVIAQQAVTRRGLAEAKVALREMLGTLIDRIGMMSDSAGHYYERVDNWSHKLEQAEDFGSLSRIVQGLLADTTEVRGDIQSARHELSESRRRVEEFEQRVRELECELLQVSSLVRRDPLTGALNRRGLEEAFEVESARAARYDAPLSLLMIDVDRFKTLNDRLGHVAGDRALVHLVTVMGASLRALDSIARIGGEEFAVLLPGSGLTDAQSAGTRLQRELIERPFEVNGAPYSLSFSAGVSQWQLDERLETLVDRADIALYRAKHEGRDRVEVEQLPAAATGRGAAERREGDRSR